MRCRDFLHFTMFVRLIKGIGPAQVELAQQAFPSSHLIDKSEGVVQNSVLN